MGRFRDDLVSLAKQSITYGIGLWATSAAGFVLVPLYVRHLSPQDYGVLDLLNRVADIVRCFALAGMVSGVLRSYHLYNSTEDRNRLVSSALAFVFSAAVLFQVLATVFSRSLSLIVLRSPTHGPLLALACLSVVVDVGQFLPGAWLRAREQVLLYTLLAVTRFVLATSFSFWFIAGLGRGLRGVVEANLAAGSAVALVATGYCIRSVGFHVSLRTLRPLLGFSLPLAIAEVPALVVANLDRYLLLHLRSATDVGVYALAGKFGLLLNFLLFEPFSFVYAAFMFKIAIRGDAGRIYGRVATVLCAVAVWSAAVVATFAGEAVSAVARDATYRPAATIVPVVLLGCVLGGVAPLFEPGIYIQRKTLWKPLIYSLMAAAHAALCWLLIPRWGALGAAWATVGTMVVQCASQYAVAQRLFRVIYEWPRLGALGVLLLAAMACGPGLADSHSPGEWCTRLLLLGGLALSVGWLSGLDPRHLRHLLPPAQTVRASHLAHHVATPGNEVGCESGPETAR